MDLVDKLFVEIFDTVNKEYKKHLKTVDQQYPFRLLKISNLKIFWKYKIQYFIWKSYNNSYSHVIVV